MTNTQRLISKFKNKTEENKEEKGTMCRALQEFYDDGIAEGEAKGEAKNLVENINNLLTNLGLTLEAACRAVGSSVEKYEEAQELLNKQS